MSAVFGEDLGRAFALVPCADNNASDASTAEDANIVSETSPDDSTDLLARVARARPKMDAADQADADRFLAQLAIAHEKHDATAAAKAVEELEDILFYLESE